MKTVKVEIAIGELADKISILKIKTRKLTASEQLRNVAVELASLSKSWAEHVTETEHLAAVVDELGEVNERLWDIEDAIRRHEAAKDFADEFVNLARSVYIQNDRRASLKRRINDLTGSRLREEKSYAPYTSD